MKKIWTTIILLSMALPAMGQQIIGPLQAQNNLDEITQNGTTATAQVNLFGYTITLGGNFATSGANSLTFTTTGPTNVTLPTSGTLATTSGGSFNNPTFTGTVTGPDSSTWTSSGIGGLTALGVNESVPPTGDVNISGIFEVAGSQIAASNLSNGTTGSGAVVLAASPTFTLVPLAPTAPSTTNTTQLATTGFTQNVTNFRKATIPIALGSTAGGTLSFATNGVGLTQTFTASGGVITSLGTIFNGGSGYKVGDVVTFPNNTSFQGNNDDYVKVTTVSGTAVTGDMILYGGTGYVSGTNQTVSLPNPFPAVFINTGILTSNLTVILPNGTGIGNSDQVAVYNNTTGSFSTTLCQSNGSDACNGGPTVIIPQGTNNSAPMLIENDATTGIYSLVGGNATFVNLGTTGTTTLAGSTISLAGNFATAGANSLTLTTTGTTNVTLPTSGTLLNSSSPISYTQLPALSANQLLGALTATTPSGQSVPSCSATSDALSWTSGTGFGCFTGYAPLASPAFTGVPTAPTASAATNTTQLATTANVVATIEAPPTAGYGSTTAEPVFATNLSSTGTVSGTGFSTYLASPPAIGGTAANTGSFTTLNSTGGALNGTIGQSTPAAGSFTNLSSSGTVSGTGFSTYLASPPAIGGTAANTGAFTNLSSSGTVSGTGFSNYLASPPAIGGTTAAAGSFTNLSSSGTVSGTGFSTYLASPPAIGGTTAAAGSFTNLSSSGTVSGTGFSNYLLSPPAIGTTTPAAGKFTTLTATSTVTLDGFTITLAGNFTTSGANPLTLTTTGTTNVTLPTSGTLLTTTGNGGSLTGFTYSQLPALSANQLLGALTATTPSGISVPSCSLSTNALTWTSGTGFGCNTLASSAAGLVGIQTFCTSGCTSSSGSTYTADSGTEQVIVEVQAPGGGSGGTAATSTGQSAATGGGGGGSFSKVWITSSFSGVTVTAPSGGAGGSAGNNSGTAGSTASFGSIVSCPGGTAGSGELASSVAAPELGAGASSSCTISGATTLVNIVGSPGFYGIVVSPGTASASGQGGISPYGSGGNSRVGGGTGITGNGYGSGGGGANQSTASSAAEAGGSGAQGIVIVYEYN